jgi:hypothetical protein
MDIAPTVFRQLRVVRCRQFPEQSIQQHMQVRSPNRPDYAYHHIGAGQARAGYPKFLSDYPLDAIAIGRPGNRLLADHQTEPGAVHSSENRVQT